MMVRLQWERGPLAASWQSPQHLSQLQLSQSPDASKTSRSPHRQCMRSARRETVSLRRPPHYLALDRCALSLCHLFLCLFPATRPLGHPPEAKRQAAHVPAKQLASRPVQKSHWKTGWWWRQGQATPDAAPRPVDVPAPQSVSGMVSKLQLSSPAAEWGSQYTRAVKEAPLAAAELVAKMPAGRAATEVDRQA